jgi:spermidine/putrescine transport system permease protein
MRKILGVFTAIVLAVLYAPTIFMIVFSFNDSRFAIRWAGFTTRWYRDMLNDRQLAAALTNTLIISAGAALIAVVLGTMAALAMRRAFRGKRAAATLVSLPIMIPDIVLAVSILAMIYAIGLRPSLGTAIAANATFNLSYVAVVVAARLEGLDSSVELAAQDLGATPMRAFWSVTFPAILPGVVSGALLAFTLSFDDFVITYFTTGPGDTPLAVRIYSMMRGEISPVINAVSTVILGLSFLLIIAALRIGSTKGTRQHSEGMFKKEAVS